MRRSRVLLAACLLALVVTVPAAAQDIGVASPGWWERVAERWSTWMGGLVEVVAASESKEPPAADDDAPTVVPLDDGGQMSSSTPTSGGDFFPGLDPNG